MVRLGVGFDIHRLDANRPLILGGVKIPAERGLQGHSDADALLHALCDALLGALGKGDIGCHFPDTDPKWKDAASTIFIEQVVVWVKEEGFSISNVDVTIFAESPKMTPHRPEIVRSLSKLLGVEAAQVNLKAKTMEGLGPIGEGQAIAAQAAVLLDKPDS